MTRTMSANPAAASVPAGRAYRELTLRRMIVACLAALAALIGAAARDAAAQIPENRALLLYNSQNADSLAVRNMYVAAHPGVVQFDLNSAALATMAAPNYGGITRANYVNLIRNPVRDFINGVSPPGPDRSQTIIVIVTTRGLPGRIDGGLDEFQISSSYSSLEADLSLLQQNLEAAGTANLPFRYHGAVDNPYHQALNQPITAISRANIKVQRTFTAITLAPGAETWFVGGLTAGDIYLACRLDAAPTPTHSALENIQLLINRSTNLVVNRCAVQALFDRWGCADPLDDDGAGATYPGRQDFPNAQAALASAGFPAVLDATGNFITGPELADQQRPVFVLGSYGENHSLNGCGENPPGVGTYVETYNLHPAASFVAFESFNGNSIVDGMQRGGQQQALDFISRGGAFTVANVAEPFTIWVADLEYLTQNLYIHGRTFAEAAYSSMPALSWQQTPVGDPLARVTVQNIGILDLNNDGLVNVLDVIQLSETGGDVTCDGMFTAADTNLMRDNARTTEPADVATP